MSNGISQEHHASPSMSCFRYASQTQQWHVICHGVQHTSILTRTALTYEFFSSWVIECLNDELNCITIVVTNVMLFVCAVGHHHPWQPSGWSRGFETSIPSLEVSWSGWSHGGLLVGLGGGQAPARIQLVWIPPPLQHCPRDRSETAGKPHSLLNVTSFVCHQKNHILIVQISEANQFGTWLCRLASRLCGRSSHSWYYYSNPLILSVWCAGGHVIPSMWWKCWRWCEHLDSSVGAWHWQRQSWHLLHRP